jgi:hypothetical protein
MGDNLGDLILRDAIIQRAAEMAPQLLRAVGRDQGSKDDQAAVTLAQFRALPDVAVNDLVRKIDELRDGAAKTFARADGWIGHDDPPV